MVVAASSDGELASTPWSSLLPSRFLKQFRSIGKRLITKPSRGVFKIENYLCFVINNQLSIFFPGCSIENFKVLSIDPIIFMLQLRVA